MLARRNGAVFQNTADNFVNVAVATWNLTSFHAAALTAPGLGGEVFEEERVHGALEADMQFVDFALRQGDDTYIGVAEALVYGVDTLLVACPAPLITVPRNS